MCESAALDNPMNEGFSINFNQDFTSITVVGVSGYRLFSLSGIDRVDEIFSSNNENTKIAERLFSSSLVAVVTVDEKNKLKLCHFKKGTEICNYTFPDTILAVKLNRQRLIVCLRDSIYIHNIRDMKLIHSIRHISPNDKGLCTLSLNSNLAYPVCAERGILQIFDAGCNLKSQFNINAHDSMLSAITFSPNGLLIATASEKGTVIRVFCVKNGQKVHELRRGMKRHVQIASLIFSSCAHYLCVSSNTETVHIFKINAETIEANERKCLVDNINQNGVSNEHLDNKAAEYSTTWTGLGFFTKAVTSYLPSQVTDILNQDRAFATVQLSQPGLKYICAITKLEKYLRLLVACEDGFLYIYNFDDSKGGECKLVRAHDLRCGLVGVTELDVNESELKTSNKLNMPIDSYACVLKGNQNSSMTESDKYRNLNEAVDFPLKSIFDDAQFPPVATVCE